MNSQDNITRLVLEGLQASDLNRVITAAPRTELDPPILVVAPLAPTNTGLTPFLEVAHGGPILSLAIRNLAFIGNAATLRNRLIVTLRGTRSAGNEGQDPNLTNALFHLAQNTAHQFAHTAPGFDEVLWATLEDGNNIAGRITRVCRDPMNGEVSLRGLVPTAGLGVEIITLACDHLMNHLGDAVVMLNELRKLVVPAAPASFQQSLTMPGASTNEDGQTQDPEDNEVSEMAV